MTVLSLEQPRRHEARGAHHRCQSCSRSTTSTASLSPYPWSFLFFPQEPPPSAWSFAGAKVSSPPPPLRPSPSPSAVRPSPARPSHAVVRPRRSPPRRGVLARRGWHDAVGLAMARPGKCPLCGLVLASNAARACAPCHNPTKLSGSRTPILALKALDGYVSESNNLLRVPSFDELVHSQGPFTIVASITIIRQEHKL
jgi:hypothetical protein